MDGAQVMKSHHGRALEAEVSLEVLGDFTDEALEGQQSTSGNDESHEERRYSGRLASSLLSTGHGERKLGTWECNRKSVTMI